MGWPACAAWQDRDEVPLCDSGGEMGRRRRELVGRDLRYG